MSAVPAPAPPACPPPWTTLTKPPHRSNLRRRAVRLERGGAPQLRARLPCARQELPPDPGQQGEALPARRAPGPLGAALGLEGLGAGPVVAHPQRGVRTNPQARGGLPGSPSSSSPIPREGSDLGRGLVPTASPPALTPAWTPRHPLVVGTEGPMFTPSRDTLYPTVAPNGHDRSGC